MNIITKLARLFFGNKKPDDKNPLELPDEPPREQRQKEAVYGGKCKNCGIEIKCWLEDLKFFILPGSKGPYQRRVAYVNCPNNCSAVYMIEHIEMNIVGYDFKPSEMEILAGFVKQCEKADEAEKTTR